MAAAASSLACALLVSFLPDATPIDRALPFLVLIPILSGSLARSPVLRGMLLLVPSALALCPLIIADENLRLLAIGVFMAIAFAAGVFGSREPDGSVRFSSATIQVIAAILVLRWIPISAVRPVRELLVIAGALVLLRSFRRATPLTISLSVVCALLTLIDPLRAVAFPFLAGLLVVAVSRSRSRLAVFSVAAVCIGGAFLVRSSLAPACILTACALLLPELEETFLTVPAFGVAFVLMALFPWSGITARAFPLSLDDATLEPHDRHVLKVALSAGEAIPLEADPHARSLIVAASGANTSSLPPGALLGRLEVAGSGGTRIRDIRIGDVSDWGYMRPAEYFRSRNRLPLHSTWERHGYGWSSFLQGGGIVSVEMPRASRSARVVASPALTPGEKLQVEWSETR